MLENNVLVSDDYESVPTNNNNSSNTKKINDNIYNTVTMNNFRVKNNNEIRFPYFSQLHKARVTQEIRKRYPYLLVFVRMKSIHSFLLQ